MDRSQQAYSVQEELSLLRAEARRSKSLEDLRQCFDRLQTLRRTHIDDFDTQILIADAQEEIVDLGRRLREGRSKTRDAAEEHAETAEVPPDVHPVDEKTWQRATYLALFFTVLLIAGFFYLIQAARKINFPAESSTQPSQQAAKNQPAGEKTSGAQPSISMNPTLRLYTDLIPGTVSIDSGGPQDLKDGELVLDHLQPGQHSIKVVGRSGVAGFTFDVAEKAAPRVVGLPTASNAMAVLVSVQDGNGHLVTNADQSQVLVDGKPAGQVGTDGLRLENLGQADHDLQVTQDKDKQRFVLTYTPAPVLTAYVKSDPNAGTVVVVAGQDGADVYIDNVLYRRKTDRGQLRIPLKVGDYAIRVHKAGFIDPPPQSVSVKKAEETALTFRLDPVPQVATLQIKDALPGTMVYLDADIAATIGADGSATISNVKPGDHTIELRRDQALPKKFERTFRTGDVVSLSGPDVALEKALTDNKSVAAPAAPAEDAKENATNSAATKFGMEMEGEQVRRGGGFVPYHVPKVPGHYFFQAQGRIGGILKHSKLQWYAGYQDSQNYVLYVLDGKHATVRSVQDGKSTEVNRIPFSTDSSQWVQVDLSVNADSINARVKTTNGEWSSLGSVSSLGRDFTQDKVGFYIPGNDEIAVSNFRFTNR